MNDPVNAEIAPKHRRPYAAVQEQTIPFWRRTRAHADRPCEHPHRNSAGICGYCGDRLGSTGKQVIRPGTPTPSTPEEGS